MKLYLDCPISEFINTKITSLHPKDTIKHAEQLFDLTDRKVLPVLVGGKYRGILYHQNFDTIKKAKSFYVKIVDKALDTSHMAVEDFYSNRVVTLNSKACLQDAIQLFVRCRQYFIPIVDDDEFVGLVTSYDVFSYILEKNFKQ